MFIKHIGLFSLLILSLLDLISYDFVFDPLFKTALFNFYKCVNFQVLLLLLISFCDRI